MRLLIPVLCALSLTACGLQPPQAEPPDLIRLTVLGSNDVHGELLRANKSGGLTTLSGYVAAVRAARSADGGAVLLVDAGDMWQGTLESNLVEGASVVEAYNAMGYAAAAIGNHEFDFGPVGPRSVPVLEDDDPRGALRKRFSEARFAGLAANILDASTGQPVDWDNVQPSILVEAAGVQVGIVGVVTHNALQVTLPANTNGLVIAPLAPAIAREAKQLRQDGADLVVVVAHAGGDCREFDDPLDLTSCNTGDEIFEVARALPAGLVDLIVAGHEHEGIAHVVNGIAVTAAWSNTYAFDRVDFTLDRASGEVLERHIYPPQINCPAYDRQSGDCAWTETDADLVRPAVYEGQTVRPTPALEAIASRVRAQTAEMRSEPLGVTLDTPFRRDATPESPIARLFTDAILETVDADISIHNVAGGIRADLPAGPLTFGEVYEIMPFDNRVVILDMSGADLRRIMQAQAQKPSRRAGFSGMQVFVDCSAQPPDLRMVLDDGREISDEDALRISTNDFLATLGDGILAPGMPEGGYRYADDPRLTRDLLVEWFRQRGGHLDAAGFSGDEHRRWHFDPLSCGG